MICHIIVGATKTGKTTLVKSLLRRASKQALFIYDVNNEYKDFFPYKFVDFETFIDSATMLKNNVLVLEEATIFLNNRSSCEALKSILVRKRHTNTMIILVFHSIRAIPRYIYELANFITVFKTNDTPDMTAKELKDERLKDIMLKVRASKDSHKNITLKIY